MVRDISSIISSFWKQKGSAVKLRARGSGFKLWGVTAAITLFAGASSFDYGRAAAVKADLEASTQAAAQAAAAAICQSNEERAILAVAAFNATYKWNASSAAALVPHVTIDNDSVFVTAKEQVETSVARIAGVEWMEVGAVSHAPSGNRFRARACLASAAEYLEALLTLAGDRARDQPAEACGAGQCEAKSPIKRGDADLRHWRRSRHGRY